MTKHGGSVNIEQRIEAPADRVALYVGNFRNAKEWMVGVESAEKTGEDAYRLALESPVGKLRPDVLVLEHGSERVRWTYTSTVEGGGEVVVSPDTNGGCIVSYTGDFHLKGRFLDRAARAVGAEHFARRNGERSLLRLKHLMEARRYG
ncbi:MAG: SRPBCC family protein [Rubrobacter sp.]|nr:SRPBCC family protein [Rubrobacter sp.]